MGLEGINWIGAAAAAILAFVVGAFWYSPLAFAGPWQKATGLSDEALKSGSFAQLFGFSFLLMLVAALAFSKLLGPEPTVPSGLGWGLIVGLFFASTFLGVHYLFERRPLALWLINSGFNLLSFLIFGLVLGLWP